MKKNTFAAILFTAITSTSLLGCSTSAATEASKSTTTPAASEQNSPETEVAYTIGIGQFAVHGSLDNCREGFLLGLAEEGIEEGKNLTVIYENANADGAMSSQIASNFLAKKADLICSIATPMAQSAYSTARKESVPVIYTAVTDPVSAELAKADKTPVGEVTGTSDKLPVTAQLAMIRKVLPEAEKIGILYSTSEINSLSAIEEYKASAAEYGFEIIESGVSAVADVPLAAVQLAEKVDCINNLTDNTVVSALQVVLDAAAKKGIPVFGSEVEQVKAGCLASVGLDYIALGKQTGHMAARVLKGEAKASEMKFEIIEGGSFYGNTKVAETLGIPLPEDLIADAAEMFSEITSQP